MVSRRKLLASTATLTSATLAGCSTFLEEESDRHYANMYNGAEKPHDFVVTVTNKAGETIFDHEYELGARSADENRIIDGTPREVTVTIDDTNPVQFPWAPRDGVGTYPEDGCSEGTSASLVIYYQMATEEEITPIYGCATVRDQ